MKTAKIYHPIFPAGTFNGQRFGIYSWAGVIARPTSSIGQRIETKSHRAGELRMGHHSFQVLKQPCQVMGVEFVMEGGTLLKMRMHVNFPL